MKAPPRDSGVHQPNNLFRYISVSIFRMFQYHLFDHIFAKYPITHVLALFDYVVLSYCIILLRKTCRTYLYNDGGFVLIAHILIVFLFVKLSDKKLHSSVRVTLKVTISKYLFKNEKEGCNFLFAFVSKMLIF